MVPGDDTWVLIQQFYMDEAPLGTTCEQLETCYVCLLDIIYIHTYILTVIQLFSSFSPKQWGKLLSVFRKNKRLCKIIKQLRKQKLHRKKSYIFCFPAYFQNVIFSHMPTKPRISFQIYYHTTNHAMACQILFLL